MTAAGEPAKSIFKMATTQLAEHQASLSNSLKRTTQAITAIVGESAKLRLLPDINCRSCNPDKMPVDDVKVRIDPFRFGGLIFDPRLSLHSEHGAVCPISVGLSTFKLSYLSTPIPHRKAFCRAPLVPNLYSVRWVSDLDRLATALIAARAK